MNLKILCLALTISTFCAADPGVRRRDLLSGLIEDELLDYYGARDIYYAIHQREVAALEDSHYNHDITSFPDEAQLPSTLRRRQDSLLHDQWKREVSTAQLVKRESESQESLLPVATLLEHGTIRVQCHNKKQFNFFKHLNLDRKNYGEDYRVTAHLDSRKLRKDRKERMKNAEVPILEVIYTPKASVTVPVWSKSQLPRFLTELEVLIRTKFNPDFDAYTSKK